MGSSILPTSLTSLLLWLLVVIHGNHGYRDCKGPGFEYITDEELMQHCEDPKYAYMKIYMPVVDITDEDLRRLVNTSAAVTITKVSQLWSRNVTWSSCFIQNDRCEDCTLRARKYYARFDTLCVLKYPPKTDLMQRSLRREENCPFGTLEQDVTYIFLTPSVVVRENRNSGKMEAHFKPSHVLAATTQMIERVTDLCDIKDPYVPVDAPSWNSEEYVCPNVTLNKEHCVVSTGATMDTSLQLYTLILMITCIII